MSYEVSIIVPVYNVENYLDKCITSILNQSFKSIEVILINDGSMDRSGEICDYYKSMDSRIKVIHNENMGSSASRNIGIENATGNYICFVDSDDWIENNMILDTLDLSKKYNADIVISGISFDRVNKYGCLVGAQINNYEFSVWNNEKKIKNNIINIFPNALINSSCNKMYKRSIIIKNKIKFMKTNVGEDTSFNLDVLKAAKSIIITDKTYYHYMKYDNTRTLTRRLYKNAFKRYMEIHEQMNNLFVYWGILDKNIINEINKTMFSQYFATIMKIIKADSNIYSYSSKKKLLNEGLKQKKILDTFDSVECFSIKEYILRFLIKKRLYLMTAILLGIKDC
ncbi:MAG: glycosyltransferase family 2 protein [Clostridium sp.]|uniref:glycosyltransferase family 2 protein n=1 Tax=Clostridium sp. TaxID=1506 RepID=UPI002F9545ED